MASQESNGQYDFEIILGTYDGYLLGFCFYSDIKEVTQSFAAQTHQGSIRSVSATTEYVVSGGSDEMIHIHNMTTRKGAGSLMNHSGTVTCVDFTPEGSHIISTSQDGSIAIYRAGIWKLEKLWQSAHRGSPINHVSIHPSGKLALTIAQNKSLKTWNLIKGRSAYTTNISNLGKYIDQVIWSTKGSYYAIPTEHRIHIFNVSVAGITCCINCSSKITSTTFFQDQVCMFGEEEGWIIGYDVEDDRELWKVKPSSNRIKCLKWVAPNWLVAVTSEGELYVFRTRDDITKEPELYASTNCECRITCISARYPPKTVL